MIPKEYQHQFPKPTEPLSKSTKKRKQKTNEQEQVEVLEDNPSKKDLAAKRLADAKIREEESFVANTILMMRSLYEASQKCENNTSTNNNNNKENHESLTQIPHSSMISIEPVIDNTIAKRKASEVESAPPPKKHQGSNCTKKPSKSREFSMDVERITSEGLKRKHKPNNYVLD